ncbi:hypothetical protein B566_EDAN001027 [Ephemera danica]|nr:hypothetical protein B566_EDAN001027 [Ephemera danica]
MDINPRAEQLQSERRLTAVYFICAALSLISLITTLVVFGYWRDTLNACWGQEELGYRNCSCLLYASSTYRLYIGGEAPICSFVKFSNVPGLVLGLCLGAIHWYRISFTLQRIPKIRQRRPIVQLQQQQQTEGRVAVVTRQSKCCTAWWLTESITLLFESIMALVAAVLLTDGAMKACDQYRQNIIETIHADGNMAALINDRLFCNAIFDFMDYLQPIKYRSSTNFINTGAALYVAMFSMWFAAIGWVFTCVTCAYEAFRYRKCCGAART